MFLCEREGGTEGEREGRREGGRERERKGGREGRGRGRERVEKKRHCCLSLCPKPVDGKQMHQHRHTAHSASSISTHNNKGYLWSAHDIHPGIALLRGL